MCDRSGCFLNGQFLAAAATAGSQNPTAILGGHAGTEAMHLVALALLGLIGTEHLLTPLYVIRAFPVEVYSLCSISKTRAIVNTFFSVE